MNAPVSHRWRAVFLVFLVLALVPAGAASARRCELPRPPECHGIHCNVGISKCGPGTGDPDPGTGPGTRPGAQHEPVLTYVPACGTGGDSSRDGLCGAALNRCPKPGDVRFFVYVSTWTGRGYGPPVLRTEPPSVCLGPEEAAKKTDPTVAVAALVRAQWQSFGLPGAVVQTQPRDETLVGAATRFTTSTPPTAVLPPKPILGLPVTLSIKAMGYVWDFGDGSTLTSSATSSPPRAVHTYRTAGAMQVGLRTYYSATFTIEGSEPIYPMEGTADVPGPPTDLTARQARTQLEAD